MTMSPQQLTKVIGDPFHVVEHEGTTYATDSYWLAPIEETGIDDLLRWWNLDVVPGRYGFDYVDGCTECGGDDEARIRLGRAGEDATKSIPTLIQSFVNGHSVQPFRVNGFAAHVIGVTPEPKAAFVGINDTGSTFYAYFNPDYLTIAFGDWQRKGLEFRCKGELGPLWLDGFGDGKYDGLVRAAMPVRRP